MFQDRDATIWFGDGKTAPDSVKVPLSRLDRLEAVQRARTISVVGFEDNTPLICALYRYKKRHRDDLTLRVGTPAIFATKPKHKLTHTVLAGMAELYSMPSSLGGWHEVTEKDYHAYNTCALLPAVLAMKSPMKQATTAARIIEKHPTFKALSFLPGYVPVATMRVLARITDPRWYVDPRFPDRLARLMNYLGIHERNMDFSLEPDSRRYNWEAAENCFQAWTETQANQTAEDLILARRDPRWFLERRYREHVTDAGTGTPRGNLRATAMFISFIRAVWLDEVSTGSELFVPSYFFTRTGERVAAIDSSGFTANAYTAHAQLFDKANN